MRTTRSYSLQTANPHRVILTVHESIIGTLSVVNKQTRYQGNEIDLYLQLEKRASSPICFVTTSSTHRVSFVALATNTRELAGFTATCQICQCLQ